MANSSNYVRRLQRKLQLRQESTTTIVTELLRLRYAFVSVEVKGPRSFQGLALLDGSRITGIVVDFSASSGSESITLVIPGVRTQFGIQLRQITDLEVLVPQSANPFAESNQETARIFDEWARRLGQDLASLKATL